MKRLLEHVRVLDLSRLLPGAYCTQLLADLGACVLKVEEPERGDYMRHLNPWAFGALNRNKQSIVVNIKHPKGKEILLQLIGTHDVLLETFRPGVMERLGLGYHATSKVNPRVVYCSLSGYGQTGPYRLRSGHDLNYMAVAGILGLTSESGEKPVALPLPIADLGGGLFASHAILAALLSREVTGVGTHVDAAMTDAALSFLSARLAPGLGTGKTRREDLVRGGAYGVYRTRDKGYIALGVIEDKFWENLIRAIGREEFREDPRFATDQGRKRHRAEIREILEPVLEQRDLREWLEVFETEDVPAAPVYRLEEIQDDPQIRCRGLLRDLIDGEGRLSKQVEYPALFTDIDERENHPAPVMGENTLEVLRSLEYSDQEINGLVRQGVVSVSHEGGIHG